MKKIKRFMTYYKPYRWLFAMDLFCAFMAAGIDLLFPVLVRYLLDNGINNEFGVAIEVIIKRGN